MSLESYEVVTTNVTAGDGHQDRVIKLKFQRPKQGDPFLFRVMGVVHVQGYWVQSIMA